MTEATASFDCPWRMFEGEFFRIDDQFLAALAGQAQQALKFAGAYEELREAHKTPQPKRPRTRS